jgi:hypothetical protein
MGRREDKSWTTLFGKCGCMSPELKWGESPTELGLWSKDSEQIYPRGSAEHMTPTLLPEYGGTPSDRKDIFSPLRFSNSGWRTKLFGSKQVSPPYGIMNDYGLLCQCSMNVLVKLKGMVFAAHSMNACSERRVIALFFNFSTRWRWVATYTYMQWSFCTLEWTQVSIV